MAKTKVKKGPLDNPKRNYWMSTPLTAQQHKPFIALNEVEWNLEEWYNTSFVTQRQRIPDNKRYANFPSPLSFMDRARHHTTRGRTKSERMMDRYWFVPVGNYTDYVELAKSQSIPRRRTIIYPPFLPKGRPVKKVGEKECAECGKTFLAKRKDALFCPGGACRKRASRRVKSNQATENTGAVTDK